MRKDIFTEIYQLETGKDYYEELRNALGLKPDYVAMYHAFSRTFIKCVEQSTAMMDIHLSGTFAKTDYLLKEHHANQQQRNKVNETRVRLRQRAQHSSNDLQKHHLTDLRNLCLFIQLIFDEPIPDDLTALFPTERPVTQRRQLLGDCLRMIVERWDTDYLYGHADVPIESEITVCYTGENKAYPHDWSYIKDLMKEGTQVNLVRPRRENDIIYPELIIVEPDYLVDISTVAKCFENYAESHTVHLLAKIQPFANNPAILLGNLASQLLDEEVHGLGGQKYADSVKEFFRHHALDLLTAGTDDNFHTEAQQQKQHIAKAVRQSLHDEVKSFDTHKVILEPSFFSEMLGLQGRMDLLQTDFHVLMEQKAGKGKYPYNNFVFPNQKEQHYVQMLLYMLLMRYNFRSQYEANNQELHAFLLYSKYERSLLGLGFSPELVFRAIRVRNLIAWAEQHYAEPGGMDILAKITPDSVNEKKACNNLWNNFQRKQIAELLCPIHKASPLERTFYLRMMNFIAREHLLSKTGNPTRENSGFSSIWQASLGDKLQTGNIYHRLSLNTPIMEDGKIQHIELSFSEDANNDMSNFRPGDIVILYPYRPGTEPDARRTMVFRCTIEEIRADTLLLYLRAAQSDVRIFTQHQTDEWAIEHDFFESSYNSLYRGMHAFLSAPKERRDLLLLQREPHITPQRTLRGDYGSFNDLALHVRQADDLFLIIGPPGTGKTSFGMLYTLREELLELGTSVLLLSFTNRAVEEICSKLVKDDIPFVRVGSKPSCSPEYRPYLLENRVMECKNAKEVRQLITDTRVFVGTTAALANATSLLQLKQFSLAIVDEASQILEPHIIGLLSANDGHEPTIKKIVLIGDHKQLPAVVQQTPQESIVSDETLRAIHLTDCRLSLFERLLQRFGKDERVTYLLTHHGRMHEEIARFPNEAFYNNKLEVVPLPHQRAALPTPKVSLDAIDQMLRTQRICFVATETPQHDVSDKVNSIEAELIADIVAHIYAIESSSFNIDETVGVIVPYRNQIAAVRNAIDRHDIPHLRDITIDTVERFQGSQRKYIIYGFTVKHHYQLQFLTDGVFLDSDGQIIDRKLNVAMTRAMEHLILIGNPSLLSRNIIFQRMIEHIRSREGFFYKRSLKGELEREL